MKQLSSYKKVDMGMLNAVMNVLHVADVLSLTALHQSNAMAFSILTSALC